MTQTDQHAELEALIARADAERARPTTFPSPRPRHGQAQQEWRDEVARIRAQHDAAALEGARRVGVAAMQPFVPVEQVEYSTVPVAEGVVTARVYVPHGEGPHPAILLLHGGAWWMGGGATGFELNDTLCRRLCAELGAVVANLDYRLAPEYPFPTQRDDAAAAVEWLAKDPYGVGVDRERLAILGISSGGNIAASTVRALRDNGGPALRCQLLLAPSLDMSGSSRSMQADSVLLAGAIELRRLYLQDVVEPTDPRVSPALAKDLDGLPPAVVVVGTEDPLRDDGKRYAAHLKEAGVPVELHEFIMTHTVATEEIGNAFVAALIDGARTHLLA